jgi:hypothetical protein
MLAKRFGFADRLTTRRVKPQDRGYDTASRQLEYFRIDLRAHMLYLGGKPCGVGF